MPIVFFLLSITVVFAKTEISTEPCVSAFSRALKYIYTDHSAFEVEMHVLKNNVYKKLVDPDLGFTRAKIDKNLKRMGITMEDFLSFHFTQHKAELDDYSPEMVKYMTDLYIEKNHLNKARFWKKVEVNLGNPNYRRTLYKMVSIEVLNTLFWHLVLDFLPYMAEHGVAAGGSLAFSEVGHYMVSNLATFSIAEVFLIAATASKATHKIIGIGKSAELLESIKHTRAGRLHTVYEGFKDYFKEAGGTLFPVGFIAGTLGMAGALTLQNATNPKDSDHELKDATLGSLWNGLITGGFMATSSAIRYRFIFYLNEVFIRHKILNRNRIFLELYYGNLLIGNSTFLIYQQAVEKTKSFFGFSVEEEVPPLDSESEEKIDQSYKGAAQAVIDMIDAAEEAEKSSRPLITEDPYYPLYLTN